MTYKNEKGFADGGCKALTDAGASKYVAGNIVDLKHVQDMDKSADSQDVIVKNIDKNAEQRANYFRQAKQFILSKNIYLNTISKKYYIGLGTETPIEIEDNEESNLFCEAVEAGINISQTDFFAIFRATSSGKKIDPISDYLSNLIYDNQKDYIRLLAQTIGLEDPGKAEYFYQMLMKWLVGCVAGALDKEQVNGLALFLLGAQNLGKSTWFENLLPKSLKKYITTEDITPDKDSILKILGNWLICFDELGGFVKKDYIFIKKIITQKSFELRLPFGKTNSKFKRQSSFCGTGNQDKILTDITGNRRFLVFSVKTADIVNIGDMDQLWAQCVSLYKSGFHYWMSKEESAVLNLHNEAFMMENIEQDKIEAKYKIPDTEEFYKYMKTSELAEDLSLPTNKSSLDYIGAILKKLGYFKKPHRRNGCNPQDLWVLQLR